MLNKILNKKSILFLLLIILILISYSNYKKTTADSSLKDQFFSQQPEQEKNTAADTTENKSPNDNSIKKALPVEKAKRDKIKAVNKSEAAPDKAERIALIAEVKDPFFKEENSNINEKEVEKEVETENINLNYSENLLFTEREIISSDLNQKINQATKNFNESDRSKENKEQEDSAAAEIRPVVNLDKLKLPFELIGTVKNKREAAAVFNYQGQTVIIKEKEKIDIFKIEKVENKKIIISLENQNLELKLWGADELES